MDGRWGLGPVFAYEWLAGSRSPRAYATRVLFVLALLAVLLATWSFERDNLVRPTIRDFADAGASFYLALVTAQLALVLLAAPAATAGAICLDKSRGSLTHLLVTDLSDLEIVLGKLAARLVPTFSLVLCALPVQFLASLLGGIDPSALVGSTLVTLGVAAFACSIALTLSVWGRKTQDVLIATYLVLLIWVLTYPTALAFGLGQSWLWKLDPFQLALARYSSEPASAGWLDFVGFLGGTLALSMLLIAVAVWRFRPVAARGDRPSRERKARREWWLARPFRPTLDRDPVLWREWHRARPSRWARSIWWAYYAIAATFTTLGVERSLRMGATNNTFGLLVIGFEAAIGLLLLSVDSSTSLADERARGSLDVLMTTPLSTRSIVWAKWRGTYRRVFGLTVLPALATGIGLPPGDRFVGVSMVLGLMLSYGAAITSLGLALATWVRRPGRAVTLGVGLYALVTIGGFFLTFVGLVPDGIESECAMGSPFYGPVYPLDQGELSKDVSGPIAALAWALFYAGSAAILLVATLRTFDRCLGRSRVGSSRATHGPAGFRWSGRGTAKAVPVRTA